MTRDADGEGGVNKRPNLSKGSKSAPVKKSPAKKAAKKATKKT